MSTMLGLQSGLAKVVSKVRSKLPENFICVRRVQSQEGAVASRQRQEAVGRRQKARRRGEIVRADL